MNEWDFLDDDEEGRRLKRLLSLFVQTGRLADFVDIAEAVVDAHAEFIKREGYMPEDEDYRMIEAAARRKLATGNN